MKQSKCFAPGCNSGYASAIEKFSLFKAPNDQIELAKWQAIVPRIDRTLSSNDVLCAKHFDGSDIIRHLIINDVKIPFKRPRLKKGALPKYFPLCPSYLYRNAKSFRKISKQYGTPQPQEKYKPMILKKMVSPNVNEPGSEINNPDVKVQTNNSIVEDVDPVEVTNIVSQINKDIFKDLHAKKESLSLSTYWAIFPCGDAIKKYILLSQMTVKNDIPISERQIVLTESMEMKYYFGKRELKDIEKLPDRVMCKLDIEHAAKAFSELYICYGGPPSHMYTEVINITECAYIDTLSGTWRHKNCTFFTNPLNSKQCAYCISLYCRFKKNLETLSKPRKRIRKKLLTNANNADVIIKRNKMERYKLIRSGKRIKFQLGCLQKKIKKLEADFNELSKTSLEDKLKNLNIPEQQITLIKECINASKCSKQGRRYSSEWIMTCLLLFAKSSATYRYIRENKILPLCDIITVHKYLRSIDMECDLEDNFLQLLKKEIASENIEN